MRKRGVACREGLPLIHIGYPKTGTTWLQRHLFGNPQTGLRWLGKEGRDHPVRRLVRQRPLEFDPVAIRRRFEPLLEAPDRADLVPVVSFERLSGHPFSGGHDAKEIADRLKHVFRRARVLIVVREQKSMILSTYKQYVQAGGPCSPEEFLKPPRSKSGRVPGFDFAHFEYHHLIGYYQALFGADALLVLAYEQFVSDPSGFTTAIGRFAGREIGAELIRSLPLRTRMNPSLSALEVAVRRRQNHLAVRSELNPAPLFQSGVVRRGIQVGARLPLASVASTRFGEHLERSLRLRIGEVVSDRYRSSNRITARLTGIDLGAYGWTI